MAQTNTVYDPETDNQSETDKQFSALTSPEHLAKDGQSKNPLENQNNTENPNQAEGSETNSDSSSQSNSKSASNSELSDAESRAGDDDKLGKGYTGSDTATQSLSKSFTKKPNRKWLIFGLGGSTTGLVILVLLLLLLASTLKIPNLAQHISTYEFARVTRQFSENAQRVTNEELAIAASNDGSSNSLYENLKSKYSNASGKVKDTWSKFDTYRPSKVIDTLGSKDKLTLTFKGNQFVGGTLNGVEYAVKSPGAARFVPGLNKIISFKNNVQFSRDFAPALENSMKLNDVGPIIRGVTARQIRQRLGIGLVAWNLGKFQGKNNAEARLVEEKAKIAAIDEHLQPDTPGSTVLNDAKDGATQAVDEVKNSDPLLQEAINNNGIVNKAQVAIDNALADTGLKTALGFVNPIYGVAVPICIVFDGSMSESGPTINNNTQQQQAAFYYIASAGQQQQQGTSNKTDAQNLAKAVRATNDDIGNISDTVPEIRASGGTVDTTTLGTSSEAGASGQFTLFNAIPGLSNYASTLNNIAPVCRALTNPVLGVTIGVLNIVAAFATGGISTAADGAAEAASTASGVFIKAEAKSLAEKLVDRILSKLTTREIALSATKTGRVTKLLYGTGKDTLKNAAEIAGATILAKLIVEARAAQVNSGFAQGADLANIAASGGNIQAGEVSRQQLFGRPLRNGEITQSDKTDKQFIAYQNSTKSFTNRYFNTGNADSLISHMAMGVSATFNGNLMSALSKLGSAILKPLSIIGSVFGSLNGRALAAPDPNTQHFGNVQFGWSEDEERLIDSNSSYGQLENQAILDNSGREAQIAKQFAICFGYTSDDQGNLTPESTNTGDSSLGELMAKGNITRDENGAVKDDGLCSPSNLSYKSPDPLASDGFGSPQPQDMIFRWRLAHSYGTTIDQLTNEQSITADNGTASQVGGGTGGSGHFTTDTTITFPDVARFLTRASTAVSISGQTCGGSCHDLCAHVAGVLWGYSSTGWDTAYIQWQAELAKGNAHGGADKYNVPVGALMFWKGGGSQGHESVYIGGGYAVSTDIHGDGGVFKATATEITNWMGGDNTYLGWSSPVFNSTQTWSNIP